MAICFCCHNLPITSPCTTTFLMVWPCGSEGFVVGMIGFMSNYKTLNNILDAVIRSSTRAINITCSDALLPKSRAPDNFKNLVLVMDYHPNFRDVPKLIKDQSQILYESPHIEKAFSSNKTCIRTGFQRTKNLKDLLVPSALPDVNSTESISSDALGCFQCDQKVCDACHNFLLPAKCIKSVVTGKCYKIRQALSCRTDYIIYCALCTLCNKQCVGSSV